MDHVHVLRHLHLNQENKMNVFDKKFEF
jgi:ankyrin repeat protein